MWQIKLLGIGIVLSTIGIVFSTTPLAAVGILLSLIGFVFSFVRFTTVQEATAKLITRAGGIQKVFIQWLGYELDHDGTVKEVAIKKKLLGGLRIWIGLPIDKEHKYRLRWHSIEEREGKRVPIFHDEIKDHVMLKVDTYWMKTPAVETKDGQFPDVEWLVRMRAINPRKVISKAPHDWVENALTVLEPLLVWYVRTKKLKEFLDLTTEDIWNDIKNAEIIQKVLKEEWGILIEEKGIEKFATIPPKAYQDALAARSKAEMKAEAMKRKSEVEASGRAAEIMGTVIEAVVRATGLKKKEVKEEFQKDPKAFYEKHKTIIDNVMTKLSMEERAYLRIETPGAVGALGDFLRLIAAWQRMPRGKGARRRERTRSPRVEVTEEDIEEAKKKFRKMIDETSKKG